MIIIFKVFLLIIFTTPFFSFSQQETKEELQEEAKKFGIKFHGFVKTDAFFDTRQTESIREGHFLLYPKNVLPDSLGNDINSQPNFNILSIQTRLKGIIDVPSHFDNAITTAMFEGEFFGTSDLDINGFRLRHAIIEYKWENAELIVGQTWHPLFISSVFPEVISFNTGVPFIPFSRNPQIKFSKKSNRLSTYFTVYTQRDFASIGPSGISSSYMRNAKFPAGNLALTFSPSQTSDNIIGAGIDFKRIAPETVTSQNYKTDTYLSSISATLFSKFNINKKITIKFQGTYAQNAFDIMGIGGYAIMAESYEIVPGRNEYTNISTASAWSEFYYKYNKLTTGLFIGYTQNLGSEFNIKAGENTIFARGSNINNIYRISPRIAFTDGNSIVGFEIEYTNTGYGDIDNKANVSNINNIDNIRLLLSFIQKF